MEETDLKKLASMTDEEIINSIDVLPIEEQLQEQRKLPFQLQMAQIYRFLIEKRDESDRPKEGSIVDLDSYEETNKWLEYDFLIQDTTRLYQETQHDSSPYETANTAMELAFGIAKAVAPEKFKHLGPKNARDARYASLRETYEKAENFVKLDLDNNCNPDWTSIDYRNFILNDKKYRINGKEKLPKDSLNKKIKDIFKALGLDNRIGKAKQIKLD